MKKFILLTVICFFFACAKKLDLKPDSSIVVPKTLKDYENILDNTEVLNSTPPLAQVSADEYFIPSLQAWGNITSMAQRNAYIWVQDIFEAETKIRSWTVPYSAIFYCNNVLDILNEQDVTANSELQHIKGWALFDRAYAFYSLVSTFSKGYDANTANTDLGIPLKLNPAIDEIVPRSTVQETYDRIINDAVAASELLKPNIIADKRNRPSKVAAFALLARVYLSMRKYDMAELYADKAMALYNTLTNFNTLTVSSRSSFTCNSEETIFYTQQILEYNSTTLGSSVLYGVDPVIINMYSTQDLRLKIYFKVNSINNYVIKGINSVGYPFTGLATDELYLIKAECLARKQEKDEALSFLNALVKTRYATGKFNDITANNSSEALEKILVERKKALIWRALRWTDLKRLNLEGRNITLSRNVSGQIFTLAPNSLRYVMPIPLDEVALSGIEPNLR